MSTRTSSADTEQAVDPCSRSATPGNTASPSSRRTTPGPAAAVVEPVDRASGNRSGSFWGLQDSSAVVGFKERGAVCILPTLAVKTKQRLKRDEVFDALAGVFSPLDRFFDQIQYTRDDRFQIWCKSPEILGEVVAKGFSLRGFPVNIQPFLERTWVTITHLPFGITEEEVKLYCGQFGQVHEVLSVLHRKVRTGTFKVRMRLLKPIPTRVRIGGYAGLAYHQEQVRTCYNCGTVGHEARKCPKKTAPVQTTVSAESSEPSPSSKKKRRNRRRKRTKPDTTSDEDSVSAGLKPASSEPPSKKMVSEPTTEDISDQASGVYSTSDVDISDQTTGDSSKLASSGPSIAVSERCSTFAEAVNKASQYTATFSEAVDIYLTMPDEDFAQYVDPRGCFRLPGNPNFAITAEGSFQYIEPGKLSSDERFSFTEPIRLKLHARGREINKIFLEHYSDQLEHIIVEDKSVFIKLMESEKPIEFPLSRIRSAIIRDRK